MAWDIAAYGITAGILTITIGCVIGIVQICRSLRRLDQTVERLGRDMEASLLQCREVAEEAKEVLADSRHSLQGFSSFAEGARALGEATQSAAKGITDATVFCRERIASYIPSSSEHPDRKPSDHLDFSEIGRSLWLLWKKRKSGSELNSDCCQHSGPSADHNRGE